ncbi:MAG: sulfotransferase [Actinomycetota bacterium]|nr:sulfotransferase [Actinomycetota bacterium]
MSEKIKVLYIAGSGRSGSTILHNLLGQIEGFFPVGEFVYVWNRLVNDGTCSCGARFRECEVWGPVLKRAFGGPQGVDARSMARIQRTSTRPRHIPLMLAKSGENLLRLRWTEEYRDALGRFYREISNVTGSRVIVDSSKLPLYGRVLGEVPGVERYVVHLVRDPRAVAYSWQRKKKSTPAGRNLAYMPRHHPVESSLEWDLCNVAAEGLREDAHGRYLMLRYEDFVEEPRPAVERILQLLGEEPRSLPFVSERKVQLRGPNHNVGGNPSRFRTGVVELSPDAEWVKSTKRGAWRLVTALTLPFLARFGYGARARD